LIKSIKIVNGTFIYKDDRKWLTDDNIIFTSNRGEIINNLMKPIEE